MIERPEEDDSFDPTDLDNEGGEEEEGLGAMGGLDSDDDDSNDEADDDADDDSGGEEPGGAPGAEGQMASSIGSSDLESAPSDLADGPGLGAPGEFGELDIDLGEEGDDDDDDEGEEGDEGEGEGEGAGEAGGKGDGEDQTAKAPTTSKKKKALEEPEPGDPSTPVPTKKKMLSALQWAFEEEEGITDELLDMYAEHAIMLLKMNREMLLTTVHDPKEVAAKHYLDSWRIWRQVPMMARKCLDFGTGGGLPGIPLAIAEPMCSMTVVDSAKLKIAFVEECVKSLGLRNVTPVAAHVEDYLLRNRVDVVFVRGVSSVRENVRTLRKVRHSLQDMVMMKGSSWSREVRAAEREAERLGFKLDTVWEHELPGEMGSQAVLVYRAPGGHGF